jgi:REP element-mobilizing transposase RayT
MIRGINRQDIFEAPEDYRKFIETLASLREVVSEDMQTKICTCHIYGYCIMPNHVHILIHEKDWTTRQSYWHELRDHQKYCQKNNMKTGTHTQVPVPMTT